MWPRQVIVAGLLVTALVATGCGGGDSEGASDDTASEEASTEGTPPDTGDVAAGADSPSPEELAELYAVPVPEGMRVVSAGEDTEAGTATFELAFDGDPDVDGYRQAMTDAGWAVDSEGPLASYGWCLHLRLADVAREIFDRLGIPGGELLAYAVLTVGSGQWQIGASGRACAVGDGLIEPAD